MRGQPRAKIMSMKSMKTLRVKVPMRGASSMKPMKSMKVMKRMKAMKVMKRAMKKSKIGTRAQVLKGTRMKTTGGMRQSDLMKNKEGKVVSKKANAMGRKAFKNIEKWANACKKARIELGLTGFVAIKKGSTFYIKSKEIMERS